MREKTVVVHLGNVGSKRKRDVGAEKTRRYAGRFPEVDFVGIDLKTIEPDKGNWLQLKEDFPSGLKELDDDSVALVSSDMTLGFYDRKGRQEWGKPDFMGRVMEYVRETGEVAYRKLKKGGKFMFVIPEEFEDDIRVAFEGTGFKREDVEIRPLEFEEYKRTFWTWDHAEQDLSLSQVTAVK